MQHEVNVVNSVDSRIPLVLPQLNSTQITKIL